MAFNQREYIREWRQAYYQKNKDRHREYHRAWRRRKLEADPTFFRRKSKRLCDANREKIRESRRINARKFRRENWDAAKRAGYKWRARNPDKDRQIRARRRARLYGTRVGRVSYKQVIEEQGLFCRLCGDFVEPRQLQFDHKLSLARGGLHIQENLQIAHARCNHQKWAS